VKLDEQLCPWLTEHYDDLARAAAAGRLGHGWIVTGKPGIGKLNLALALASGLLTGRLDERPEAATPDSIIAAMQAVRQPSDHHPDLHLVFPEEQKKTISVEQVRAMAEPLQLTGLKGKGKVVVIEPAEAMTTAASNALLKLLEEPTADTYLFLVAHRIGRLTSTIRSRCQTLLVRGPSPDALETWLGQARGEAGAALPEAAPLVAAARRETDYGKIIIELEDSLNRICEEKTDPLVVADQWSKQDVPLILDWLIGRLERAIRSRVTFNASNPVTVPKDPLLQNRPDRLTLSALLEQRGAAQRLEDQLGGGVSIELALRALLLGFSPSRGR
jgi:DNA polymerase III subunit delta'